MSSKAKTEPKKMPPKWKYNMGTFAVVKFYEIDRTKLFDSIPDLWFANEEKTSCYWPPKFVALRAMNQDLPEDDWDTFECEVVSEGHATYSIACNIVREKAAQNYNTSSADEHIQAAQFRRQHPGLIHNGQKCFEDLFAATKDDQVNEKNRSTFSEQNTQKTWDDTSNKDKGCDENPQYSPVHSGSHVIHPESYSESQKRRSKSRGNRSGNDSKRDNQQARNRSQPRSRSKSNDMSNKTNEYRDGNHQIAPVYADSLKSRRSRSRRTRSRSRRTRSRSRRTRSRYHRTRSRSRRTRSRSRKTRSRSRKTRSRSQNSNPQQPRDNHQSRTVRSQTRSDYSQSRSNRSLSNSCNDSPQHDNRSRSRSRSIPRMRSRSVYSQHRGTKSRSHDSEIGYTQKGSNRSPVHISRSETSRYSLQSEKVDRRRSKSPPGTVQKMYPNKPAPNYRSNRSSFCDVSGRYDSNGKANIQQHDFDRKRGRHCAAEQPETPKNHLPVSPRTRNRLRVNEIIRLHQLQRAANSSTAPRNSQKVSSPNLQAHCTDRQHQRKHDSPELVDKNYSNDSSLLQTLLKKVREIERIATKNDPQFVESDRRLTRLEVIVNKSFILLGDMSNAINTRALIGNTRPREDKPPKGFRAPKMPINHLRDLIFVNDNLANKEFFRYLVNCEKEFCCCSSSTDVG